MNSLFGHCTSTLRKTLLVLSVLVPTFGVSSSAHAAERVYASYSALERSISVSALEAYAKKGVMDEDLAVYAKYLKPEQLQQLRRILLSPIKVNPVAVSQFLYTPQGEFLLRRLGEVIRTKSRQPEAGLYALRSALILASSEKGGLTFLNLLRKYPITTIHIDLSRTLGIATELEKLVNETQRAIAAIAEKSSLEAEAIQPPINISKLPDLRRKGKFAVSKRTLSLYDTARRRFLLTEVYLPNVRRSVPVIVISHGLGSDSSNFAYIASYLASHGYAIVVPNHPGSDTKQLRALLNGSANEVAQPDEFFNRPLDIKYILNRLEVSNRSDPRFRGRLNLQKVGVFGHSLGGYTALALAGAKFNFEQLDKNCQQRAIKDTWNMSLLLQCRALQLQDKQRHNLRDERVKAVIAVNPLTSAVFGKAGLEQLQVPVMMLASGDDTIAPALYEQIIPFSWISHSQKYLAVLSGATHFSAIGDSHSRTQQVALPSEVVGESPSQARRYINTLSLPFFGMYVAGDAKYTSYLNAAYAQAISQRSLRLSLIQSLTPTELARKFGKK